MSSLISDNDGETRTFLHCHSCSKDFYALLDYSLDGNHEIECAHCGHIHYRRIQKGKVTDDRWHSDHRDSANIKPRRVWKSDSRVARTTSAAELIRERMLRRIGGVG